MSHYIPIKKDAIYLANMADLVKILEARGEQFEKSGMESRMKSDPSITIRGHMWYDHSSQDGGYPIEFMKKYYNMSFQDSICALLNETPEMIREQSQTPQQPFQKVGQGGSSPQQGGNNLPPQQGSPPQQGGNNFSQQQGNPHQQGGNGYPPQQGSPPQQGGNNFPPQQGSPPQQGGNNFPPQQGTPSQQGGNYLPPQQGSPHQQGGNNFSQQQGNPHQQGGNNFSQQQGNPHQQGGNGYPPQQNQWQQQGQNYEKQPFELPNRNDKMSRTFAYLTKGRMLDYDVISHFAKARTLYESCESFDPNKKPVHNAVFVGIDENGVPRHAHKHGLNSEGESFKRNVMSSESNYSFHHVGTNDRLFVFEAPIDMMSFISMYKLNWEEASYVSLCGVGSSAVDWMTQQYPHLQNVVLCLDNDRAGMEASNSICKEFEQKGYTVNLLIPERKDWNEDLVTARTQVQEENFSQGVAEQGSYVMNSI
ncbi:MAG: toprim domain-containing protein [Eubacteriales bacterium]